MRAGCPRSLATDHHRLQVVCRGASLFSMKTFGVPPTGEFSVRDMMSVSFREPSFWQRVSEEPHRVFFPLGVVAGVLGALAFPLFYMQWISFYPQQFHPRMMTEGFVGAFVTGFLGTAAPRFLGARRMSGVELVALVGLWLVACTVLFFPGRERLADCLFAAQLGGILVFAGLRMPSAKEVPPPGFVVAFAAVLLAIHAIVIPSAMGQNYLRYGFWLLPVVGVGSYLVPRFFVKGNGKVRSKISRRVMLAVVSVAILASFWMEVHWGTRVAFALRGAALLWWCLFVMPGGWPRAEGTRGFALKCSLWALPLGYFLKAAWPGPGFAFSHVLFISGLGSIMLLVGDRVSIGHAKKPRVLKQRSTFWRWVFWLMALVMLTRVSADLIPSTMVSHYIYAAVLWAGLLIAWAWHHARHWW